jgi:hypothetical protein
VPGSDHRCGLGGPVCAFKASRPTKRSCSLGSGASAFRPEKRVLLRSDLGVDLWPAALAEHPEGKRKELTLLLCPVVLAAMNLRPRQSNTSRGTSTEYVAFLAAMAVYRRVARPLWASSIPAIEWQLRVNRVASTARGTRPLRRNKPTLTSARRRRERHAARPSSSFFSPLATILSALSERGRCSFKASSACAAIQWSIERMAWARARVRRCKDQLMRCPSTLKKFGCLNPALGRLASLVDRL